MPRYLTFYKMDPPLSFPMLVNQENLNTKKVFPPSSYVGHGFAREKSPLVVVISFLRGLEYSMDCTIAKTKQRILLRKLTNKPRRGLQAGRSARWHRWQAAHGWPARCWPAGRARPLSRVRRGRPQMAKIRGNGGAV